MHELSGIQSVVSKITVSILKELGDRQETQDYISIHGLDSYSSGMNVKHVQQGPKVRRWWGRKALPCRDSLWIPSGPRSFRPESPWFLVLCSKKLEKKKMCRDHTGSTFTGPTLSNPG